MNLTKIMEDINKEVKKRIEKQNYENDTEILTAVGVHIEAIKWHLLQIVIELR